jgi:hypothetical protein
MLYDYLLSHVVPKGTWFDFGPSDDPATASLNTGVHAYKESFGARTVLLTAHELQLA